jgi:serine/threonine protein kinase
VTTRSFRGVRIIRFGEFELNVRAAELRRNGERVRLQEQPFRILAMLLEHPGEVVLREDIRRKLWPNGTIVEVGHGINAAVLRLREALGESAENPRYVETLARRGYRFAGQADVVDKERSEPPVSKSPEPAAAPALPPAATSGPPSPTAFDTGDLGGQTISHYRVIEKVGSGGMGVVYRAEDLKLGRHVALKFLPPELGGDPTALGRFQREARAASALNHPNICTVYGVEEYRGQPLIVMEMLEGETLEARLAKGPLPVAKALTLAIQMADALDAAHRRGIVHRDLKPGNVLVTRAGAKVLDFGLAKIARSVAMGGEEGGHVTQEGAILGTLHYMSPEQVQGKDADAPSDIFSFGLVLYEMLSGKRAFPGENSATVMAAILTWDPPELREPIAPAGLDRILRRCLAKEPEERWQTACDLKAALEWIAAGWTPGVPPAAPDLSPPPALPAALPTLPPPRPAPDPPARAARARWSRRASWIAALAFAVILAAVLWQVSGRWDAQPWRPGVPAVTPAVVAPAVLPPVSLPPASQSRQSIPPAAPSSSVAPPVLPPVSPQTSSGAPPTAPGVSKAVTRFTFWPPGDGNVTRLSLSPDGRSVAFLSGGRILVRAFDSLEPRVLEGTEGAGTPFWSPDGRSLAFASRGQLKTIRVEGGLPVTLCKVNTNMRGAWGSDGTIIIGMIGDAIFRVPVATGVLTPVTRLDPAHEETRHMLPQFLPDGRRFLFIAGAKRAAASTLYAGSLDSSEQTPIMPVSSSVEFVSSRPDNSSGYLIFARDHILMAQAFDPDKLHTIGKEFPVAGPITSVNAVGTDIGVGDFSATGGTLAYRSTGIPNAPRTQLVRNPGTELFAALKGVGNIIVVQNWMAGVTR